jgi:hypothetical protein
MDAEKAALAKDQAEEAGAIDRDMQFMQYPILIAAVVSFSKRRRSRHLHLKQFIH